MKRGRGYGSHVTGCCLRAVIFTQRDWFLSFCLLRTLLCQIIRSQTTRREAPGMLSSRRKWPRTTRGTMLRMPQSLDEPQMGRRRSWGWLRGGLLLFPRLRHHYRCLLLAGLLHQAVVTAPTCLRELNPDDRPELTAYSAAPVVFTGLQQLSLFR